MKIAVISPWEIGPDAVGGTERFIIDLAEALNRKGHHVDVFMFDGNDYVASGVSYTSLNLLGEDIAVNEYTLRDKLGDFSELSTYMRLAEKLERVLPLENYDIVHINTQLLLRAWSKKRRIFTIHTNDFEFKQAWGYEAYQKMISIARNEALDPGITLTAPSEFYAEQYSRKMETSVICIPHAIEPSRVISKEKKDDIVKRYGLGEAKIRVLLPSRLEPLQKQPGIFFDALTYVEPKLLPDIQVLSSGVDPQYEKYKQQYSQKINDLGCSVFFGRFEQMSDAYALSDVVVLPSRSESFGYAALESLILGIPTFLNDIPTFREIAKGNDSAHFFNNSPRELAVQMNGLFSQPVVRHPISSEWKKRYAIRDWILKYEELL